MFALLYVYCIIYIYIHVLRIAPYQTKGLEIILSQILDCLHTTKFVDAILHSCRDAVFFSVFFFSFSLIFGFQFLFVSICLLCFIIILIIWNEYFAKISLRHRDVMPSKKFSPLTKLTNSGNEGRQMCTLPWCLRDSLSSRLSHFIFIQSSKRLYKNHSN